MGIAARQKPAFIKIPIKRERVKRPRLFPLLISKPWPILSLVTIPLNTLLFASSMLAQVHSFLCIFDSDALGLAVIIFISLEFLAFSESLHGEDCNSVTLYSCAVSAISPIVFC